MSDRLTDAIRVLIDEAQRLHHDDFEAALNAAFDDLASGEPDDDQYLDSVLSGVRWGVREFAACDAGGSTVLHVRAPRGVRITHEWRGRPQSAVGRASVMQTVREAMGDQAGGEEVTALWNEAARQTCETIAEEAVKAARDYEAYSPETADRLRLFGRRVQALAPTADREGRKPG